MTPEKELVKQVKTLLWERGQEALEIAKQSVLQEKIEFKPLQEALHYFMEEIWGDVLHPALLSLTCEAVGGNPDTTTHVGAATVLLASGADVHDDIIDQSLTKDSKPTVFGKFGKDIAILLGDFFLLTGCCLLCEASEQLTKYQKQSVLELVKQAFFDIANAEAKEASIRGKFDISAEEYLDIIKIKVSVSEAMTKIGAILGGGNQEEIEALGHYGKTLGILLTIRDEFIDVFELDELKNRVEKEVLPLPIIAALQDPNKKDKIITLLTRRELTETEVEQILDLVMSSKEARKIKKRMRLLVKEGCQQVNFASRNKETFKLLLWSTLENI
jgi:geranylgeranyl diphosphate synthase type I